MGHEIEAKHYDWLTFIIAYALVCNSLQRQGAIANMTLEECDAGRVIREVYVVRVHQHKTAQSGSAVIMFDTKMNQLGDEYKSQVRPKLVPNAIVGNEKVFFLTLSGLRITNIAARTATIGKHLGFKVYTPSESWATHAALNLPVEERRQVGQQMSHSKEVDEKYYALTQSMEQAAGAYEIVHHKRPKEKKEEKKRKKKRKESCKKSIYRGRNERN